MNEGLISGRYAKALYKHCTEKGNAEEVYQQMKQLAESFRHEKLLQATVDNPYLASADKEKVLLTAAGALPGSSVDKFVLLLIRNNRVDLIRTMALSYGKIYRQANSIAQVTITTASSVEDGELERIKNVVKKHIKADTVEYMHNVNPELIGGFTVCVDSQMLDASVKNELKKLRLKLLS